MTGSALLQLRRQLRMSQQSFAALVGVTANTVARWERGEQVMQPSMERLVRLATANVTPMRRKFNAGRGGHAPGHLRNWFETYLETGELDEEMQEKRLDVQWLIGQLWNCRDIMPGGMCDELDVPPGSSFAVGVRALRQQLAE